MSPVSVMTQSDGYGLGPSTVGGGRLVVFQVVQRMLFHCFGVAALSVVVAEVLDVPGIASGRDLVLEVAVAVAVPGLVLAARRARHAQEERRVEEVVDRERLRQADGDLVVDRVHVAEQRSTEFGSAIGTPSSNHASRSRYWTGPEAALAAYGAATFVRVPEFGCVGWRVPWRLAVPRSSSSG